MTRRTGTTVAAAGMALLATAGGPAYSQNTSRRIELPKPIPIPALPKPLPLPNLNTSNPVLSMQSQSASISTGVAVPPIGQVAPGGSTVNWGGTAYHYGAFPSLLPGAYYGMPLQSVLQPSIYTVVAVYGLTPALPRYLVGVDTQTGWVRYSFDIRSIGGASIGWVQTVGNVLYISYATSGLLTSGAVLAFDLTTGQILWNTPGQIANAPSFAILGNHVVTGWGGPTGPGYIYVLDRRSGRVLQRSTLDSAPRAIVASGSGVTVRSRAKEYRFRVR